MYVYMYTPDYPYSHPLPLVSARQQATMCSLTSNSQSRARQAFSRKKTPRHAFADCKQKTETQRPFHCGINACRRFVMCT